MIMEQNKLKDLFAALCAASIVNSGNINFCIFENNQTQFIITFKDDDDFVNKAKSLKINTTIPIKITTNRLSNVIFTFINKNFKHPKIYVNDEKKYLGNNVFGDPELAKQINDFSSALNIKKAFDVFLNKNESLRLFIEKRFKNVRPSVVIGKIIDRYRIATYNNATKEFTFTHLGNLLFSSPPPTGRMVDVKIVSENLRFINEKSFTVPLINAIEEVPNYLYENEKTIQIRQGLLSRRDKLVDLPILKNVFILSLSRCDFSFYSGIDIRITPVSISFSFVLQSINIFLDRFLADFFAFQPFELIKKQLEQSGVYIFEKKRENIQIIELAYFGHMDIYDSNLDDIDYKILDYASEVGSFSRSDVENFLNYYIATRTIIFRLNKLIHLGYLKRIGNGKFFKYYFVNKKEI